MMTETQLQQQHDKEAAILFGSTPHVVFDEFDHLVNDALVDGVASLPLLPKTSVDATDGGDKVLMKLLHKSYLRNVDVAEMYACRNIFSIRNLAPTRRDKVVQAFLSGKSPSLKDVDVASNENDENKDDFKYPSKEEIPSPEAIQGVQDEINNLRNKLREANRRKNQLLHTLKALVETDDAVKNTSRVLNDSTNTKSFRQVHGSVTAAIMGKEGLDKLVNDGTSLSHQMDQDKRQREENGENDDAVLAPVAPPQKKLTLQEQYQQDRKQFNIDEIQEFKKQLKR